MLKSDKELAEYWVGCDLAECEDPQRVLEKWVYRKTEMGLECRLIKGGAKFKCIIEGEDWEPSSMKLYYPFSIEDMLAAVSTIENEIREFLAEKEANESSGEDLDSGER